MKNFLTVPLLLVGLFANVLTTSALSSDTLRRPKPETQWGLKSSAYPLPSLEVGLQAKVLANPVTSVSGNTAGTYSLDLGLSPWQFKCAPRKFSYFHGAWTLGAYATWAPEHIRQQITWTPYEDENGLQGLQGVPTPCTPVWGHGYEVGGFTRFSIGWTFPPKLANAGTWTVGLETEMRLGYIDSRGVMHYYDPNGTEAMYHSINFQIGMSGFVQYRKDNWSVKAQLGAYYDTTRLLTIGAGISIGYHF